MKTPVRGYSVIAQRCSELVPCRSRRQPTSSSLCRLFSWRESYWSEMDWTSPKAQPCRLLYESFGQLYRCQPCLKCDFATACRITPLNTIPEGCPRNKPASTNKAERQLQQAAALTTTPRARVSLFEQSPILSVPQILLPIPYTVVSN